MLILNFKIVFLFDFLFSRPKVTAILRLLFNEALPLDLFIANYQVIKQVKKVLSEYSE